MLFTPKVSSVPSSVTTHVWLAPHATSMIAEPSVGGGEGLPLSAKRTDGCFRSSPGCGSEDCVSDGRLGGLGKELDQFR